jgi:hypothetical protein
VSGLPYYLPHSWVDSFGDALSSHRQIETTGLFDGTIDLGGLGYCGGMIFGWRVGFRVVVLPGLFGEGHW